MSYVYDERKSDERKSQEDIKFSTKLKTERKNFERKS